LLEALVLAVRETQDSEALVLAGQVAGDLRQAQDALGDTNASTPPRTSLGVVDFRR
jgi:hypothetical protein